MSSDRERASVPFSDLSESGGVVGDPRTSTFGDLLRGFRRAAGLTQEQLAERAGLSAAGISALERGARTSPQRATVRLLADALELGPEARRQLADAVVARQAPNASSTPDHRSPAFLPVALDALIGREHEVRAICELLNRKATRLVTLSGPGGVGKTRLALEIAERSCERYPDGVTVLALDSVRSMDDVLPMLAQRLGIGDRQRDPLLETVIDYFRSRRALLVLDNLEHLLAFRDTLERMLPACPALQFLVTSRAALNTAWETRFPVGPLAVPDLADGTADVAAIAESPAVALFVRRGRSVRPDFDLTPANAAPIAEICRRLEGIPLALELAAMRLRLLAPSQLLERLNERLPLLSSTSGIFTERHRALHSTIAWSYDLLRPLEQRLFRALAVFAGGYTVEAVEAIFASDADSDPMVSQAILAALEALVDQSLIAINPAGADDAPRLSMLEMIREYAQELLTAHGEADELRSRHRRYFLGIAQAKPEGGGGVALARWLDRLELEYANLRLALQGALALAPTDQTAADDGLALLLALRPLWEIRGYGVEGRRLAEAWLRETNRAPVAPRLRIGTLLLAGGLALRQGDLEPAEARLRQAIGDARACEERALLAGALCRLGEVYRFQGRHDSALACLRESLSLARTLDAAFACDALIMLGIEATNRAATDEAYAFLSEAVGLSRDAGDVPLLARALQALAVLLSDQGKMDEMRRLNEEALSLFRQIGDRRGAGITMGSLGHYYLTLRDYRQAETVLTECLAIRERLHDVAGVAHVSLLLGTVANRQGRLTTAQSWFEAGVAAARSAGDLRLLAHGLDGLGSVLCKRGDLIEARRQHAECLRVIRTSGIFRRVAGILEGAALTESAAGNWRGAVWLFAVAAAERERLEQQRDSGDFQARVAEAMTDARRALGDADFDRTWERGAELPPGEAITRLLDAYERFGAFEPPQRDPVTPRERLGLERS